MKLLLPVNEFVPVNEGTPKLLLACESVVAPVPPSTMELFELSILDH